MMKYLLTKDKLFENWLNPVLSGATTSDIVLPSTPSIMTRMDDIETPLWMDTSDPSLHRHSDVTSIGAYFINGQPLTQWGAAFGSTVAYQMKNVMQNWYDLDVIYKHVFPNGTSAYINKDKIAGHEMTEITILKMAPAHTGIGLNIYVKFKLDGEDEIWGKFTKVGIDPKPAFISQDMEQFDLESKIIVGGKLFQRIMDWMDPKPGVYRCLAKEVLVYTEFGQIQRLTTGNIVEVISSNDGKIKIRFADIIYIIKKPTYYWFNYYFDLVKR